MLKHRFMVCLATIAYALICLQSCMAQQTGELMSKSRFSEQITETITKVRTGETPRIRDEAAQHLAEMTKGVDPNELDDKTISDMVSLLDLYVGRYWVAVSLGNVGLRARKAIPKLEELLAEEECRHVSKSAAGGIRYALTRMGVAPLPFPVPCPKP